MRTPSLLLSLLMAGNLLAQKAPVNAPSSPAKPQLVVGIVIDQMRWDYLTRYYSLFQANGGFRRMLGEGFSCDKLFFK